MALTGLQRFARELLTASFDGCGFDGGDIQELAEKHGLIKMENYSPDQHKNIDGSMVEVGMPIYVFNDVLE